MQAKSKNFTESKAWQEGHKLVLTTYRFLRAFPAEEQFSLSEEMKRMSVALTTNIAEALSTESSVEKMKFLVAANASMIEFQNYLLISRDVGFLKKAFFDEIARQAAMVNKHLTELIKASQR